MNQRCDLFRIGFDSAFSHEVSKEISGGYSENSFCRVQLYSKLVENVKALL